MNEPADRPTRLLLAAILVAVVLLYGYVATRHALVVDEAIHGRGGLAILAGDWNLSEEKVQKPFFVYYALALSRGLLGGSDAAGRVGPILATLGAVAFLFRIGRRWFGGRVALVACALFPFTPLAIKTLHLAKTDAFTVFFLVAAAALASAGRAGWSGLLFALAFCTRQLAVFTLPLVLAFLYLGKRYPETEPLDPDPTRRVRPLRCFAVGTAGPLALLLIWSAFTRDPFAWLLKETSQIKYAEARAIPFGIKFAYWYDAMGKLLGPLVLRAVALLALPAAFLAPVVARFRGHRLRERPDLLAIFTVAAFVLFYLLIHCIPKMTLHARYMVPTAPWVSLLVAWALVRGFAGLADRLRLPPHPRRAAALAVSFLVGGFVALTAATFVIDYSRPIHRDEVPGAAAYLRAHARRGSIVFMPHEGPEFSYYLFRSGIEFLQYEDRPARMASRLRQVVGGEAFLFASDEYFAAHGDAVRAALAPLFVLRPEWPGAVGLARLYRIEIDPRIGLDARTGAATYADGDRLTTAPYDCALVYRSLARGFAKWREKEDPAPELVLDACDIAPSTDEERTEVPALAFTVRNLRLRGVPVAEASLRFDCARIDLDALLAAGRLVVREAEVAEGSVVVRTAALAEHLKRKNREIEALAIRSAGGSIRIEGRVRTPLGDLPFLLDGHLAVAGGGVIELRLSGAQIGGFRVPRLVLRHIESRIGHGLVADLPELGLMASSIAFADDGEALVIRLAPRPAS